MAIENETHFLLGCELYADIRSTLFERALCIDANFYNLETGDTLHSIMQRKDLKFTLGNTVYKVFQRRKMFLYS